jgi:tRNA_anti-like
MKKNIAIFIIFSAVGFFGFKYLYGGARDYISEEALKVSSVATVIDDFSKNQTNANTLYLNKVIEISGKVTQINAAEKSIMIDNKLYASLTEADFKTIKKDQNIKIKGRLLGYDELLEEIKLDNCLIIR